MFPGCSLRLKPLAGSTAPIPGLAENGAGGGRGKQRGACYHPLPGLPPPHRVKGDPRKPGSVEASGGTRGLKLGPPWAAASPARAQSALESFVRWAARVPVPAAETGSPGTDHNGSLLSQAGSGRAKTRAQICIILVREWILFPLHFPIPGKQHHANVLYISIIKRKKERVKAIL